MSGAIATSHNDDTTTVTVQASGEWSTIQRLAWRPLPQPSVTQ